MSAATVTCFKLLDSDKARPDLDDLLSLLSTFDHSREGSLPRTFGRSPPPAIATRITPVESRTACHGQVSPPSRMPAMITPPLVSAGVTQTRI